MVCLSKKTKNKNSLAISSSCSPLKKKKKHHILVLNPEISDTPISPLLVELFISR